MTNDQLLKDVALVALQEGPVVAGYWLACQLRDAGRTQVQAEEIVRQYAVTVPSYSEAEIQATLERAYECPFDLDETDNIQVKRSVHRG
jgi:hypothetical protein